MSNGITQEGHKIWSYNGDQRSSKLYERCAGTSGTGFMQTLAFLWYELEAAKRHVEEAFAEPQQSDKADFSFLINPSESHVVDERAQRRLHLSLRWIAKEGAGARS